MLVLLYRVIILYFILVYKTEYLLCSFSFSKSGQLNLSSHLLKQNLISLGITFDISLKLSIIFSGNFN